MIRARMGGLLLLGIDADNVERLKKGQPLHVHQVEVDNGQPITGVAIVYGETMDHIVERLKGDGLLPPDFVRPPTVRATKQ